MEVEVRSPEAEEAPEEAAHSEAELEEAPVVELLVEAAAAQWIRSRTTARPSAPRTAGR